MEKLQIIAAVILTAALLFIVNMIRKRTLELKYALAWILVLVLVLIVDLVPAILNVISYFFGIATPVNTLFLLAFCFSIVLIFVLTVTVSRLSERIRQLSQALALTEAKVEELAGGTVRQTEDCEICVCALPDTNSLCAKNSAETEKKSSEI